LLSLVRSNPKGIIGFLNTSNRICVALSRAKQGMYVIGNGDLLLQKNDVWKAIIQIFKARNLFSANLTLSCQNHPDLFTNVRSASDFKAVAEGGCKKACTTILPCGHTCSLMCHPYDHRLVVCIKRITVTRPCGHTVSNKICNEELGPCEEIIIRTLPCGHTQPIPCYIEDWSTMSCKAPCARLLKCGHPCPLKCVEKCPKKCHVVVSKEMDCGHCVNVECSQSVLSIVCHLEHDSTAKDIETNK